MSTRAITAIAARIATIARIAIAPVITSYTYTSAKELLGAARRSLEGEVGRGIAGEVRETRRTSLTHSPFKGRRATPAL